MNNSYQNNQKGFTNTPSSNQPSTQNSAGQVPPRPVTPQTPNTSMEKKNILVWVLVLAMALVLVVFIQRGKTDSPVVDDNATTTVETTDETSVSTGATFDEVMGAAVIGVSQEITKVVVSRHPDLTTDVEVRAGGTVLRNFTVTLQERSNITPVLTYIKKNMNTTLSYDGILKLVVFEDVTTNIK